MPRGNQAVVTLDEAYRPVIEKQWFFDAGAVLKEDFDDYTALIGSENLVYHSINMFEQGRIPPMNPGKVEKLKRAIDEIREVTAEFPSPATYKYVIKPKGAIALALQKNKDLELERKLMLQSIQDIFGLQLPYSGKFSIVIGRVFERAKEQKVKNTLNSKCLTPVVSLGKFTAKVTLNGEKAFFL